MTEVVPTVIIGGGQAGLAMGYHLKLAGEPFVIIDAGQRVGDSWRARWDSLRLFSLPRYASLPGWPIPAPTASRPATRWPTTWRRTPSTSTCRSAPIPGSSGSTRTDDGFLLETSAGPLRAGRVIVASGVYQHAADPGVRRRPGPGDHPAAFESVPQRRSTARRAGADRRRRQLRRRHRPGVHRRRAPDLAGRSASGAGPVPGSNRVRAKVAGPGRDVRLPPGADAQHADRPQGPSRDPRARRESGPGEAGRSGRRRRRSGSVRIEGLRTAGR